MDYREVFMNYIAHFREETKEEQLLKDHLIEVAQLANDFGEVLGLSDCCYLAGLLHDMGKYFDDFQKYINLAKADPEKAVRGSVDHSTAGGKLIAELCAKDSGNAYKQLVAEIVGNAIISHHSSLGLQNLVNPGDNDKKPSDYLYRVNEKLEKENLLGAYEQAKVRFFMEVHALVEIESLIDKASEEIQKLMKISKSRTDMFFITKFVYSCLIDADRTNTRIFEEASDEDGKYDTSELLNQYHQRFEIYNQGFSNADPTTINQLRAQMSDQCFKFAEQETGTYTLSIPTGGGKTLSGFRFALKHAKKYEKQRIIYIAPFMSILEQNTDVIKEILGDDEHIIEHHSNIWNEEAIDNEEGKNEILEKRQELLRDNWDAPIIFTTMVQFLETIYAKGTRRVRRFHNLMNAVLIFDEVQSVPIHCVYMFVDFINFAQKLGKTTNVLCTATQPGFDNLPKKRKLLLSDNREMIKDLPRIQQAFKRVEIVDKTKAGTEFWKLDELADFSKNILHEQDSLLIILNTKTAVRELFKEIKSTDYELFHLSTSMCAAHRKEILAHMKKMLKEEHKKVLCVTTQLIEAGVDISFQNVIRSMAGLDSIAQAAGRCNRSGEFEKGTVYLVNLADGIEKLDRLPTIKNGKETTQKVLKDGYADFELLTHEPLKKYFKEHYRDFNQEMKYPVKNEDFALRALVDYQKNDDGEVSDLWSLDKLSTRPKVQIRSSAKTIAKYFKVIDSPTKSVMAPHREKGKELIATLNSNISLTELNVALKKAQQYTVNLFEHEFQRLCDNKGIYPLSSASVFGREIYALQPGSYSEDYGLDVEGEAGMELNMF
jgi:CRISPR-associated endonuclease/helicase Cas3